MDHQALLHQIGLHDLRRPDHGGKGAGEFIGFFGAAGDIHGDHHKTRFQTGIEWQRIGRAAVNQHPPFDLHRFDESGHGHGGRHRADQRAAVQPDFAVVVKIGGDDGQRDGKLFECFGHFGGPEQIQQAFAVHQHRIARIARKQVFDAPDPRLPQTGHGLCLFGKQAFDMRAQLFGTDPRRTGGAQDRTDGRAGNGVGDKAQLLQGFQHQKMGQPTGTAAAQHQTDARAVWFRRFHDLAFCAQNQPACASGRT